MSESGPSESFRPRPVLIFGPTASGKSALALAVARRLSHECGEAALIVNADALQVYDGWSVLTARPGQDALSSVEHALYGHVSIADADYSAGRWHRDLAPLLSKAARTLRPVVIVGGTGLYFNVLTKGIAPIPAIPPELRAQIEAEIAADGVKAAARRLTVADPETAAKTDLNNPRRILRALEVLQATGRGMAAWAAETPPPLLPLEESATARIVIDRGVLRDRIAQRLETMAQTGALTEVAAMLERIGTGELDWSLPSMQALGAPQLAAHLQGEISLEEALASAATETGRYAKRQDTWGRNQCRSWRVFEWGLSPDEAIETAAKDLAGAALVK